MDLQDERRFSFLKIAKMFTYAIQGFQYAIRHEKNMRRHLVMAIIVLLMSFIFKLALYEWLFILLAIFGVIALELINSAIERAVDIATDQILPIAKQAKDMAAAAVLIYAIFAIIIGSVILGPKLFHFVFK